MAVTVSKSCQEIAVCVKHDIRQIVMQTFHGREQMSWDDFVDDSGKHGVA